MTDRAIVTGASKGIGRETARLFRARGWEVLSISRGACPVDDVRSARIDLAEPGWEDAAQRALDDFFAGHVPADRTCLVHNAAWLDHDSALELPAAKLRAVLELNVIVPASLNRLLRARIGAGSSILYLGSTLSEKAVKGAASYATSKHAVVGLMRATCQDLAGAGAHTACVCPGFTDTEMLRAHVPDAAVLQSLGARTTIGRLIEPVEIAELLVFCAEHPVVNGSVLHAHLGQIES